MRKVRLLIHILLFALFTSPFWAVAYTNAKSNYYDLPRLVRDSILSVKVDSVSLIDSTKTDTLPKKKQILDDIVNFEFNDSLVMTGTNMAYLFGDSKVDYTTLTLKAENISMNMDSSIAHATYGIDTTGTEFGYPVFTDNGVDYEARSMRYNMKTQKMFVNGVITEQGEGYVTAGIAKKTEDSAFFMKGGTYTTCDQIDCPHFHFALTKAKVRPGKDVVTGPVYLVMEGLPIPFIGLPFGYFPFSDSYSSGVIMPTFGDEMDRGFYLRDGGYYFAISDYMDLALTGEIYTKGSWGLNARSSYRKRYKYSGSFDAGYIVTKRGDKKDPDYSLSKDFKVHWTHTQDPKANMFRTLSASVNFSTSSYDRNQLNSMENVTTHTQNTKGSTVNFTQRFPNSPWSISATMSLDQQSSTSMISMTMPNMTASMSRVYPFKRKQAVGSEKWYEKIQISYTGQFRNRIQIKESEFMKASFKKDWQKAAEHRIPINATFNLFNYINITPSLNYTERWYTEKMHQKWDGTSNVVSDTTYGFHRVFDFNASLQLQTKMYGFFKPLFDKKTTIRHVFTPSISYTFAPDFSDPRFGYYDSYQYYDGNGVLQTNTYPLFQRGMFGSPSTGRQSSINFTFDNNIEMKREMNDTIKKISLIDNLRIGFSYNAAAPSFRWSDMNMNLRLKLSKQLTVNLNANFDPYTYDLQRDANGQVMRDANGAAVGLVRQDKMRLSKTGSFGRLRNTSYSISPSINQDTFKKWFGKDEKKKNPKEKSVEWDDELTDEFGNEIDDDEPETKGKGSLLEKKKDTGEYDSNGYLRNEVKWSLTFGYNMTYAYNQSRFNERSKEYKYKLTHSLHISGNIQPTKNWSMNFQTTYDFENKKFPFLQCNISRDLHCFTLSANFSPMGPSKFYTVSIRASSSMLRDLKYDKRGRSSGYDPEWD